MSNNIKDSRYNTIMKLIYEQQHIISTNYKKLALLNNDIIANESEIRDIQLLIDNAKIITEALESLAYLKYFHKSPCNGDY